MAMIRCRGGATANGQPSPTVAYSHNRASHQRADVRAVDGDVRAVDGCITNKVKMVITALITLKRARRKKRSAMGQQ